jgi:hypothetical protein
VNESSMLLVVVVATAPAFDLINRGARARPAA